MNLPTDFAPPFIDHVIYTLRFCALVVKLRSMLCPENIGESMVAYRNSYLAISWQKYATIRKKVGYFVAKINSEIYETPKGTLPF